MGFRREERIEDVDFMIHYGAGGVTAAIGESTEPEWPSGVWRIDFDDAGGDGLVCSTLCDSLTGLILSVWLDKVTDILGLDPANFHVTEADINDDTFINIYDVTLLIDIILDKE